MKAKDTILTKEEKDILVLAALHCQPLSNFEIGQRLGISTGRVKTLIHQACVKLGAHNRNEALFFATRRGEINVSDCYSFDELAAFTGSLGPDMLKRIAYLMRQEPGHTLSPAKSEQLVCADRSSKPLLTKRERDVLILAGRGLTNKQIADNLCISLSAVRTFLNRTCTKLQSRNRADAVLSALKRREICVAEICSPGEMVEVLAPLGADGVEKIAQLLMNQKPPELFLSCYDTRVA